MTACASSAALVTRTSGSPSMSYCLGVMGRGKLGPLVVLVSAIGERWPCSFEDVDEVLVDSRILDAAGFVCDGVVGVLRNPRPDNLFGVADDGEIRVVRHHDDLSPTLCFGNTGCEEFKDALVIEVLLGLIDDQWPIVLIDDEVEDEQEAAAFARCELRKFSIVDAQRELRVEVLQAEEKVVEVLGV